MEQSLMLAGGAIALIAYLHTVRRAFATGAFWGWFSVLPPLWLTYALVHFRRARFGVILMGVAAVPFAYGSYQMAQNDPEKFSNLLKQVEPNQLAQQWQKLARVALGELRGQAFQPEDIRLYPKALVLREGADFYAQRQISVLFNQPITLPLDIDVLPSDPNPPVSIELSWIENGATLPEARQIKQGYTLRLLFKEMQGDTLDAELHLVLPEQYQSRLSGKINIALDYQPEHVKPAEVVVAPVTPAPQPQLAPHLTAEHLIVNAKQWRGKQMDVLLAQGGVLQGSFMGLDDAGRLVWERRLGGTNIARLSFEASEIKSVSLLP